MLNVTRILIGIVTERASAHFGALFPGCTRAALDLVKQTIDTALNAISRSDALYHNVEHTAHVTLVGLEIIRAKQEAEGSVSAATWANIMAALLCHDIGYVRGLCRSDTPHMLSSGGDGQPLCNAHGSSDAMLMPVHINRGKRFVEETFLNHPLADVDFINACIERTRFPVPDDPWYAQTRDYPALVRAADLIGQLSDPRYLNKLSAIFFEFEEIGFNRVTGYTRPGDLLLGYPAFFERHVAPYIGPSATYLERNEEGREMLSYLYGNLARARAAVAAPLATAANA